MSLTLASGPEDVARSGGYGLRGSLCLLPFGDALGSSHKHTDAPSSWWGVFSADHQPNCRCRPAVRIGGKLGANISSSGMSVSYRPKLGVISTGQSRPRNRANSKCLSNAVVISLLFASATFGMRLVKWTPGI